MITRAEFKRKVWNYYQTHKRSMPWRTRISPYWVVVSELMLQQTQVSRVVKLFPGFVRKFPSFVSLARASRAQVLRAWQGLGYNRRALYMRRIAQRVVSEYKGIVPRDPLVLKTFVGIGPHTAASICAFAFNIPTVFVETNIRTVFLHHFFKNKYTVSDEDILLLIKKTLDTKNPREWYWALMDYGAHIKRTQGNPNTRSAHYMKQSKFEGSTRQLRGKILKLLLAYPRGLTFLQLRKKIDVESSTLKKPLAKLLQEEIVSYEKKKYVIV